MEEGDSSIDRDGIAIDKRMYSSPSGKHVSGKRRPSFTPSPSFRRSKKKKKIRSFSGNLVEAVKKKFVFLEDSCLPQTEVVYELEQAVGHKVTKVQAFDVVQKLGKIDKKTSRIGSRKDAIDRRQRMYL